jgi:hypothetical protein
MPVVVCAGNSTDRARRAASGFEKRELMKPVQLQQTTELCCRPAYLTQLLLRMQPWPLLVWL